MPHRARSSRPHVSCCSQAHSTSWARFHNSSVRAVRLPFFTEQEIPKAVPRTPKKLSVDTRLEIQAG